MNIFLSKVNNVFVGTGEGKWKRRVGDIYRYRRSRNVKLSWGMSSGSGLHHKTKKGLRQTKSKAFRIHIGTEKSGSKCGYMWK